MQTTRHFIKEIGSIDAEVFRFIAGGAGVTVAITNEDENNALVYKFQESSDGVTWVDKVLPTGSSTSVSFVVESRATHQVKLPPAAFYRMLARGNLLSMISLNYSTVTSLDVGAPITVLA